MTEITSTVKGLYPGTQNPWFSEMKKIFARIKGLHSEADLFDLLGFEPQMWAAYSIGLDRGIVPVLTFTKIDLETGEMNTEFMIMSVPGVDELSPEYLAEVKQILKNYTYIDVTETLLGMESILNKQQTSQVFTSTFIAIEIIWQKMRDRIKEYN